MSRTESISRRLSTLEAKMLTKKTSAVRSLLQSPAFLGLLDSYGVTVEAFQRNGLAALPRDLLRAMVDRLKAAVTAG